jgi:outer membrane protein, multidrug efflux system
MRLPVPLFPPPLLLIAAVALSGCAHLTPDAPPPATPGGTAELAWSEPGAARNAAALAQWWQLFQDPLLTQLVDAALRANTDIRSAATSLAQARALRELSAAGRQPQVDIGASAGRSRSGSASGNSVRAGLDASWEIDVFGASGQALRGAEADVRTAQADLAAVQVAIAGEVGLAYVQLRGYQLQRSLADTSLASQLETQQITAWRAQAGLASSLDAEQARATAEQTRASLPVYTSNITQTEHRLAVLLGLAPKALHERLRLLDDTRVTVPAVATPQLPLGLPAETLRARPDVQAAEHAISAEAARLSQRRAQALPSFAISGSLAVQAATVAALSGGAAVISSVAAAVSWPLWDGGANRAQQAAQEAVLARSQISYEATVLTALQDVEDALAAYHASQAQRLALEQADEAAQNALLLARQRYQAGLVDFTTLLEAQRSALGISTSLAAARTNESLNLVLLYKGLGGGWNAAPAASPNVTPVSLAPTPRRTFA